MGKTLEKSGRLTEVELSVIVPAYNAEKTIKRCIESVLKQSYRDFEIIVVNDGSEDLTSIIVDDIANQDTRVKLIETSNQGVSNARNVGIEYARGNYLIFIDSDDYIEPNAFEVIMDCKNGSDLVIWGYSEEWDDGTNEVKIWKQQKISSVEIKDLPDLFVKVFLNVPWNKLYDREIIRKNQLKFEVSMRNGEDLAFNYDYLSHCEKIAGLFINIPIYHYTRSVNGNSLSQRISFEVSNILRKKGVRFWGDERFKDINLIYVFVAMYKTMLYSADYNINGRMTYRWFKYSKEFEEIFRLIEKCQNVPCSVKIEMFLLKHNMYKIDYSLRKCSRFIKHLKC